MVRSRVSMPIVLSMLSLGVIVGSCFYCLSVVHQQSDATHQLRQLTVQRQHAEQRLHRLNDSHTSSLLHVLGEDVSAVQIRIAEFLTGMDDISVSPDNPLMYEQSVLAAMLSTGSVENTTDTVIKAVRILRVDLQVQLSHAEKFIALLQEMYVEIGGWPTEVRACDLQRMPMQGLKVRCTMDIYHWSVDIDA